MLKINGDTTSYRVKKEELSSKGTFAQRPKKVEVARGAIQGNPVQCTHAEAGGRLSHLGTSKEASRVGRGGKR